MPDEKTHSDSIRFYHTGAATNGAAQATPDNSLGGYPSSTEYKPMAISSSGGPSNVTYDKITARTGTGTAYVDAPTSDTLRFKAPGSSSYGNAVSIANGETKVLEDGDDAKDFIRVTRTSATNLSGTATLTITDTYNNAPGFDNVTTAEATAGDDEYRCVCYKNENPVAIQDLLIWIEPLVSSAQTTDTAQLSGSGAGSITTTGSFAGWPDAGHAAIWNSGGTLQEVVYYSSRTDSTLTVPAAGRGRCGTSATAGNATDTTKAVPGVRIDVYPATAVGTDTFTGSGLDDLTTSGTQTVKLCKDYRVEIDATGTPDTFKWSNDGGSTWEATGVSITGAAQTLENGVQVTFGATTGHTLADRWDFVVGGAPEGADEDTMPAGLSWSTVYSETNGIDDGDGDLDENEICYVYIRRDVTVGHVSESSVINSLGMSFDAA